MGMNLGTQQQAVREAHARPAAMLRRYRVVNGGRIAFGGQVTIVRAGKVVDDLSYDLSALRDQGIVLEEVADPASG